MRKKVFCCILGLVILTACGGEPAEGSHTDPVELGQAMSRAAENLPPMSTVTQESENADQLFRYLSDLDYGKVAGYYFSYAAGGTAEEIAVISLKDGEDAAAAKESLERHLADRIGIFSVYSPDQVPMAEEGMIVSKGNLIVLVICENASEVMNLFTSGVQG